MSKKNDIGYENIHDYLDQMGVLSGTAEQISNAKEAYWKLYRNQHKKNARRHHKPEINIAFSSKEEIEQFKALAKAHNRPLSTFIRESARSYALQGFVQPNAAQWEKLVQLLKMAHIAIGQVAERAEEAESTHYKNYHQILEQVLRLERELDKVLNTPPLIEVALRDTIQKQPWRRDEFIKLLKNT